MRFQNETESDRLYGRLQPPSKTLTKEVRFPDNLGIRRIRTVIKEFEPEKSELKYPNHFFNENQSMFLAQ